MQKDPTQKNNSFLKLCPLIGREEVYDIDPISLEEYNEELLQGILACEKKLLDSQELLNEEAVWLKKSKKLLDVIQLEIEERHAVEEFGMLLKDQQVEDEFFRKLEDFSSARERNFMYEEVENIEEKQHNIQNNHRIYENPIIEESDIADNEQDGKASPSRISWGRLMAMRKNQSNVFVKQKGQDQGSIQDFMRKTLSNTLIEPTNNNSARINPFGKDSQKNNGQSGNNKTTSNFRRKKPQTSQHKQNSSKQRSESTGRGDRNRLIAVTILPKSNTNVHNTILRNGIKQLPAKVVGQDTSCVKSGVTEISQDLRKNEIIVKINQNQKEVVIKNEGQCDIDGKNDQIEIKSKDNNECAEQFKKQKLDKEKNILQQSVKDMKDKMDFNNCNNTSNCDNDQSKETQTNYNNEISQHKNIQNINKINDSNPNNDKGDVCTEITQYQLSRRSTDTASSIQSRSDLRQAYSTGIDDISTSEKSEKGYFSETTDNSNINPLPISQSIQRQHLLLEKESYEQSQSHIFSSESSNQNNTILKTTNTTTTHSNQPTFFNSNPTNSLQQQKDTNSTITNSITHTTASPISSQFFQQLSQSFYPQSFASVSSNSSSQTFSNKLRLPSLPLQYQQQLQQSLAYLQYSPIPIQPQALQSASQSSSLQQKESEMSGSLEFSQFHKKNGSIISSNKQPRKSRTLLVLSSQSSTRHSNNTNNPTNNSISSKYLDKIALSIGQDADLIDYSSHFTSFNDLFSGYYLSANSKDVNILDIMIDIYETFREHAMKVDINPAAALSAQLSRIAIQTVNPSPAETKTSNEILRMSNKLNINLNIFIQRNIQYEHNLQRANDENQDKTDSNTSNLLSPSQQPYYRVVKNKTEVFQIVSKSFLRQPSNWTELPHALNLKSSWNVLWTWSKPQIDFKKLIFFQKVNHFLQNKNLSRKDLLIKNLRLAMRLGPKAAKEFDIMPMTYLLPKESAAFTQQFYVEQHKIEKKQEEERFKYEDDEEEEQETEPSQNIWIIKPTSSSQGRGIFLINDLSKVIYSEQVLAQKYLSNPLLIRGHKFDMRIYVLVTSFHPLEVFLYKEGFARLSSRLFSMETNDIEDRYIHLTNYAVQKENLNQSSSIGGSKMSLTMLKKELEQQGIKWSLIWNQVIEIILKSLISCEGVIANNPNSFELFGYDIIVDDKRQCWLLEINASPSLNTDYLLDDLIKQQLIDDILGILQIVLFDRQRLLEVLQRRIQEQQRFQSTLNIRNNSSIQLNRDLNYILHKQKIRKTGETPDKLGEFQQIAPSDAAKRIQGIIHSYKHSNNTSINYKMNTTSYAGPRSNLSQQQQSYK